MTRRAVLWFVLFAGVVGLAALVIVPKIIYPANPAVTPELTDAVRDLSGKVPVFPGAEGFGTDTSAGRGGRVIRVTSLEAAGPGTLREALETPGPRSIVFEVGGVVRLSESLVIPHPFVTVAGQTAPSPGITLAGAGLVIATHDALVRHLRVRVGDAMPGPPGDARDGLSVYPGGDGRAFNVVVDHCSVSWAVDEGASHWGEGVSDVTFRNCIFSENLSRSIHPKGEHSKGLLLGNHGKRIAVIGCLFASNRQRSPYVKGDVSALVVNNLIYNPGTYAVHVGDYESVGPNIAGIYGNVLWPGPDTWRLAGMVTVHLHTQRSAVVCVMDNLHTGRALWRELALSNRRRDIAHYDNSPVQVKPLTLRPASETPLWVLANAGARPGDRDAADLRAVRGALARTGRIIDSQEQVGGMPAAAEVRRSLALPENPEGDDNGNGHTNLEEWLHGLARRVEGDVL